MPLIFQWLDSNNRCSVGVSQLLKSWDLVSTPDAVAHRCIIGAKQSYSSWWPSVTKYVETKPFCVAVV